jgi:steroid 5-alpha reductase family enzyme
MYGEFFPIALLNLSLILFLMTGLWGLSLAIRDSSIADIFWGIGLVIVGWFSYLVTDGDATRRLLVAVLVTVWGVRLALYIGRRNWGREDARYARLRAHVEGQGKNYALHSLIHIYWQQGFFMWLVGLVLIFPIATGSPQQLGLLAWIGVALWVVGMFFETVGDWQLARFLDNPDNQGRVMDQGLWRYTRHPNYFGESCVWVGFFLIALENPLAWITIISPAVIIYVLVGPLGKELLERRMSKKRPEFADYKRRTSGFFPLPPRKP